MIETITGERDRLLRDRESDRKTIDQLRQDLDRERELVRGLTERLQSLEREIHNLGGSGKGIMGYLTDGWKKLVTR